MQKGWQLRHYTYLALPSPLRVQSLQVKFSNDYKTVEVQTLETAPGGARTERVALPYDPDLYHHMVQHGVNILVSLQACCAIHKQSCLPTASVS